MGRKVAYKGKTLIAQASGVLMAQPQIRLVAKGIKHVIAWLQAFFDYKDRVETDSGAVQDDEATKDLFQYHEDEGLDANLVLHVHSDAGLKTRTSGGDEFVEKAYDMSGGENDAAQATEANQPKLVSDGMEFDGVDDYVEIANSNNKFKHFIEDLQGSISLWINPNVVYNTGNNSDRQIIIGTYGDINESVVSLDILIRENGTWGAVLSNGSVYVCALGLWGVGSPEENKWQHLVLTLNGNEMTLYADNSEVASTPLSGGTTNDWRANWVMGTDQNNYERDLDGKINDIRIFNKALSASEIQAIYDATKAKYGH